MYAQLYAPLFLFLLDPLVFTFWPFELSASHASLLITDTRELCLIMLLGDPGKPAHAPHRRPEQPLAPMTVPGGSRGGYDGIFCLKGGRR